MSADAIAIVATEAPEGYELYTDDPSTFAEISDDGVYPVYINSENRRNVVVLNNYHCNVVDLEISLDRLSEYEEMKEKYADLIGTFDVYQQTEYTSGNILEVSMYDRLDEDGNAIQDPSLITSKRGDVQKMCRDFENAGILISASYKGYTATMNVGWYEDFLHLNDVPETEEEAVTEFVKQQFGSGKGVEWLGDYSNSDRYWIGEFENADEVLEACAMLNAQFEGASAVPLVRYYAAAYSYDSSQIDLLEDTTGDVDGDGNVSVEDAVSVLSYYARQAAGLENVKMLQESDQSSDEETAYLSADVNGDGEVTVEDAVEILTYYAKQSAGLDATW
jgi:hypothetical protein